MPAEKKTTRSKKSEEGIIPVTPVEPALPVEPVVEAPVVPAPIVPVVPVVADPASAKPGLVQAIAIMTLVNGILNILIGAGVTGSVVLGTVGIGILCSPFTILPLVLGIVEVIYAGKLLGNQQVQPSSAIAILEICCILAWNPVSLVVGILALVFYGDANVKAYFARINA